MRELVNLKSLGFPAYSVDQYGAFYSHITNDYDNVGKRYAGKTTDFSTLNKLVLSGGGKHQLTVRMNNQNGDRVYRNAALIVAKIFVDNPEGFSNIAYIDGNIDNIAASNLKWIQATKFSDPGYTFVTVNGTKGTVLGVESDGRLAVRLMSDKAISNKHIVLTVSRKSVRENTLEHPYAPTVLGIGCIGFGINRVSQRVNGVEIKNPLYNRWYKMLYRCKIDTNNRAYYGLPIDDNLLIFQNYANLISCEMNERGISDLEGFEVDKDFLSARGSGYMPETITVVPSFINGFASVSGRSGSVLPPGISYSPIRGEMKTTTMVSGRQIVVKSYRVNCSDVDFIERLNDLINTHLRERANLALTKLRECEDKYPNYKFHPTVRSVMENFSEHIAAVEYSKSGWNLTKIGRMWVLSEESVTKAKAIYLAKIHSVLVA